MSDGRLSDKLRELIDQSVAAKAFSYDEWAEDCAALLRDHGPELLRALEDAERLEWMSHALLRRASIRIDGTTTFKAVNAWSIAADGTDLRAAIDQARQS